MENKVAEQFKGFLSTSPLWEGEGPFGIKQFPLSCLPTTAIHEDEIISSYPSLLKNFVLGKRMESFFGYIVKKSTEQNLIAENLQISRNRITIGELDFVLENKPRNEFIHLEMVYKFYVYDPTLENEEDRWIGPNRKDSLPQKISKLKNYQFPLIGKEETKEKLLSLNLDPEKLKQMVCFKANLFVPRSLRNNNFPLINNSCICGYWINFLEFNSGGYENHLFFAPKKPDWPIDPATNEEWVNFSTIQKMILDFHKKQISPLIWSRTDTGIVERFFVVWW